MFATFSSSLFYSQVYSSGSTYVSGQITSDTTWTIENSPYVVDSISIPEGITLTIEPGVVVKFANIYSTIHVDGTLLSQGTESQPIYFTSIRDDSVGGDTNGDGSATQPTPGDWLTITFTGNSSSSISHTVIRYGGRQEFSWIPPKGPVRLEGGNLAIADSQINNNHYYNIKVLGGNLNITNSEIAYSMYGIYSEGGIARVHNSSFHDFGYYGIYNLSTTTIDATSDWWGDSTGPYHPILNSGGLGVRISDRVDFVPWLDYDPTKIPVNQPPTPSNLNQYKSDGIITINEGQTTTESTVIFRAILTDPDNDQIKLQVELKKYSQPFDESGILESNFIPSGNEATITIADLTNGQYKWRARAVDSRGAFSAWQEFGIAVNIDFVVKLVPLYTQVESPYPSWDETKLWAGSPYAYATPEKPYPSCGWTIGDCGCAISSAAMLLQYHNITTAIDNKDVTPLNFNDWLNTNSGYTILGDLDWPKVAEYAISPSTGLTRIHYDGRRDFKDTVTLDVYLEATNPVILYNDAFGHFLVADGKLSTTYTVKDPAWYKTRKLDEEITDWAQKIRDYNNNFDGLRLFSPLLAGGPVDGISLNLASPAELLVVDPTGRKLGKDPITNISYNEIPGGSYGQEGISNSQIEAPVPYHKTKNIWIPDPLDGQYDIQVIGTETESYTMELLAYDQNGNPKDIIYQASTAVDVIQAFELNYSKENIQETESYRIVNIDIKPGSYPNSINLKSKGVTPVAVLTDKFFNAKDIVINSVIFAGATPTKGKLEDVDNDGDLDLILHFKTQSLQLSPTSTEAVLTGQLTNGTVIKGTDSVRIIQEAAKQTILAKFFSYINQLIQNIISAVSLAAIK